MDLQKADLSFEFTKKLSHPTARWSAQYLAYFHFRRLEVPGSYPGWRVDRWIYSSEHSLAVCGLVGVVLCWLTWLGFTQPGIPPGSLKWVPACWEGNPSVDWRPAKGVVKATVQTTLMKPEISHRLDGPLGLERTFLFLHYLQNHYWVL